MKCFFLLFSAASWSQAKVTDTQANRANTIGSQHSSGTGIMEKRLFLRFTYMYIIYIYIHVYVANLRAGSKFR